MANLLPVASVKVRLVRRNHPFAARPPDDKQPTSTPDSHSQEELALHVLSFSMEKSVLIAVTYNWKLKVAVDCGMIRYSAELVHATVAYLPLPLTNGWSADWVGTCGVPFVVSKD